MQKTAFLLAYTKKSTTLCFQVLIIRSVRVVCKLHHIFLPQVLALVLSLKRRKIFYEAFNFAQENITNHFICASKSFSFKRTRHNGCYEASQKP